MLRAIEVADEDLIEIEVLVSRPEQFHVMLERIHNCWTPTIQQYEITVLAYLRKAGFRQNMGDVFA